MSEESKLANLNGVINSAIETRLKRLHTQTPGIIESFNPATGRASIQPAIRRVIRMTETGEERIVTLPLVINCPVGNLRAGGFALTLPIKRGDECMLCYTQRSLDAWIKFGDIRQPNDFRLHDETDAYFLPVYSSEPKALSGYDTDNMVLRNEANNLKLVFDTSGNLTVDAVSSVTVNAPNTQINSDVTIAGTLEVSGTCDLATDGPTAGVNMNGGNLTNVLTTGSINPITGTPYPDGNENITGDA